MQNIFNIFIRNRVPFTTQNDLFWRTLLQHLSDYVNSDWFVALSNIDHHANANSVLPWRILFHSFVPSISRYFFLYTVIYTLYLILFF